MAYTTSSFKTRARTIDHLGREQIADCPTAISELWKNAYDAYATEVSLHLFDGEIDVAALFDNGHGMSREEFETKWLTVGTESKTDGSETNEKDRNGLPIRAKQGQKGIGRLSSAALGPVLLLISKRKDMPFVATLIDWRLFENPFLYLDDVRIPITEFDHIHQLFDELPIMFDHLMGNLWGDSDDEARTLRLTQAWKQFSEQEIKNGYTTEQTTKSKIENTLIKEVFTERHFNQCPLWNNDAEHGTAMFVAQLQDDLKAQLSTVSIKEADDAEATYRSNFLQTLSSFTDPYSKENEPIADHFNYSVIAWHGYISTEILTKYKQFNLAHLEELEHAMEGEVDSEGYFRGRVKVFGKWFEDYTVRPKQVYKMRRDSQFGPFHIRVGTFEMQIGSTSLSDSQFAFFSEQAELYGGFRVYRDGLRVMPYGRPDSDYFGIEERRSKRAGTHFWASRRMFGRVLISREDNPNLKDKAGREGFIENRASKLFREVVENILTTIAKKYFSSESDIRMPAMKSIQQEKALLKAAADKNKLLTRERSRIRKSIKNNTSALISHIVSLQELQQTIESRIKINSIDELQKLKSNIDNFNEKTQSFSLSPIPPNLGRLEDDYRSYRKHELVAKDITQQLTFIVNKAIAESTQKSDYEKATEVYRSKLASINSTITRLASQGKEMISKQQSEFEELIKRCREQYKIATEEVLEDLKLEKISLDKVLTHLDEEQEKIEIDNRQTLSPYVTALERVNEQIDLEGLAIHSMNETSKYQDELSRLHSLAQLGITVEIIGHELEGLDLTINHALKEVKNTSMTHEQKVHIDNIERSHASLVEKLRFLSPLKLSGEKISRKITGKEIAQYVHSYFEESFARYHIEFTVTDNFKSMTILDMPSRIYPVFINLVNNSLYWLQQSTNEQKTIKLDLINNEVFISDNGPGIDPDDLDQLFTLFFTRKQRGGRGVGLYLSKQNLQASGHKIRYETNKGIHTLSGANFAIEFKGMSRA